MDEGQSPKKKEKVLHTRVSAALERDLKDRASELGISVSNLVRNVLGNTVDLVENIVADSARVAGSARDLTHGHSRPLSCQPTRSASEAILGWQEVTLNLNAICTCCNEILPRGEKGALGISSGGISQGSVLCLKCLASLPSPDDSVDGK
ncbi:MAG: hypothetical protein VYA34_07130 [Myxococcota bacterium]|nr:hypothetical protein [Myxococcota bacterium]